MKSGEYMTRYEEMRSNDPRGVFRHAALSSLGAFQRVTGTMAAALSKDRVQFLYLHHVFEDQEDSFRSLLQTLSMNHRFVSYSEGVDRVLTGNIDGPYISISFDDGLKNCLQAARIMGEFGATGCFFACPSMVGEMDYIKVIEFCVNQLGMPPTELLSWDDVATLLTEGHEVGSHTMTHSDLSQLNIQQVQDEVGESFEMLTRRIGDVKHFAWPFGRFFHFSPGAARAVFEAGYTSCASAERGCHGANSKEQERDICIRRDHIVAGWPISHALYFMARSSRVASIRHETWPAGWWAMKGDA